VAGQTSALDFLLGKVLAPGRQCGECVACCDLLYVPELKKPARQRCPDCTGTGCGIWETRPSVCRNWHCVWRMLGAMPPETRPDKLGVMFEVRTPDAPRNILSKRYIRGISLGPVENFEAPLVRKAIDMFSRARVPVWLDHNGQDVCVHPPKPIQDVLIHGLPASSPDVAAEAATWRSIYEPL
jgi:hypothetical protein